MRILITSGGTREPIDDVRYVGNTSTGRTGALLAEEAVRRFHTVHHLSGIGAAQPEPWAAATGLLVPARFGSCADLLRLVEGIERQPDVVIAAAAVADYSPVKAEGKLPSSHQELTLHLRPTPKVLDRMRSLFPAALLVAFKLEAGIGQAELVARATRTMGRSGADLVVANLAAGMGGEPHAALLLDRSGLLCAVETRRELAARLLDLVEERRRHE
jgi:phosphopantothenoylcysteine decarboxylase/phosphopantothenate--cysteine ligase